MLFNLGNKVRVVKIANLTENEDDLDLYRKFIGMKGTITKILDEGYDYPICVDFECIDNNGRRINETFREEELCLIQNDIILGGD